MPREDAAQFNGTLKTATYPNKYNAVIPAEGPFYRIGLKLTVKDATVSGGKRTLIEGLDYYLGYYFKELAEAEQDQIYGGFILLTATEVEYEILSVGRQYRIPQSEIGKYLVRTDLKDPRNVDWSELMKYAPVISPIDPPENIEEAILRDEVVKALEDIRLGIIERASELDTAFTELTDMIYQNGNTVFDQGMYQHHLKSNAHGYTTSDIGALPVVGKAVDATKAFGRTLAELVTAMSNTGISQAHVDLLMDNTLGDLLGRLRVLNNDAITFQTSAGHLISMKGEKFIITSPKPLLLKADQDNNEPGLAVETSAGLNTLWVHSGKAGDKWGDYDMGVLAPVYNSVYLVTPDMVGMYLTSVKLLPANAYFKSSDTLKIYGSGKDTNRVYMNVELPTATETVAGLFSITNISNSAATGAAISQKAVNDLKNKLDLYVDDTYTINGKKFVKDSSGNQKLTLIKTDFGIDKMDNTTPLEKPVTKALATSLTGKSKADHTHTINDLDNVPYGSTTGSGLLKIWDAIDTTDDKVVTSRQGFLLDQKIDTLSDKINTLLPAWTVGGARYGNDSFLPIPTVSNFAGFGYNRAQPWGAARYERGNVYLLRNGTDGPDATRRVYYWYAPVDGSNKMNTVYPTAFPYHPDGMSKFPGVTLIRVIVASADVGLFEGSDGAKYLVLFNGTMDYAKHSEVFKVTFPDLGRTTGDPMTFDNLYSYVTVTLTKGSVVFMATHVTSDSFKVGGWKLALKSLTGSALLSFGVLALKWANMNGDMAQIVEDGAPELDNPSTKRLAYLTTAGSTAWPRSRTPVNYRPSIYSAAKINTLRVRAEMHGYFANHTGVAWSDCWSVVYNVDVDTGTLTVENPLFPVAITENKLEFPNGTAYGAVAERNTGVARFNVLFAASDFLINSFVGVYDNNAGYLSITPLNGEEFYDALGKNVSLKESSNKQVVGAVGSVYKQYMRGVVHLGGSERTMLLRFLNSSTAISMRYDLSNKYFPDAVGYGPDNLRTSVDYNVYKEFLLTPNVWKDNKLYMNGRIITAAGSYPYKNIDGTTTFSADRITVTDAIWSSLESAISAAVPLWSDAETIDKQFSVHTFDIGGLNAAFLVASYRTWENTDRVRAFIRTTAWKIPMSVNNGNVSFGTSNWTVVLPEWYDGEAAISLGYDQSVNSKLITRDDGYVVQLGTMYRSGVIGDSRWRTGLFSCDAAFANWTTAMRQGNPGVAEVDIFLQPETGYIGYTKWLYLGLYLAADIYQNLSRTFATGTPVETFLGGVKTAEGWNLYITEEELLAFGSARYKVPTFSADIRDLYPTNYKNRTLYMHAALVNGQPVYQLLEEPMPDTDTRLYIGYMTSDSERITFSNFDRVKRLGSVKQLEEHAAVAYRHDVSAARDSRIGSMGQLKKEALTEPGGSIAGYADGQLMASAIARQKRPALPIQQRFGGIQSIDWIKYSNYAERFWIQHPTITAAVSADNSAAAAKNMIWVGVDAMPVISGDTYYPEIRLRFNVPGSVGDPAKDLLFRFAFFNGTGNINANVAVDDGTTGKSISVTHKDNAVEESTITLAAGVPAVLRVTQNVPASALANMKGRFMAVQIIDPSTGDVIRQADENTPFSVTSYKCMNVAGSVRGARELVFTDLPSSPVVVVHAANEGINPPFIADYDATTKTLKLTVAWFYGDGITRVTLTELQVNLMFTS